MIKSSSTAERETAAVTTEASPLTPAAPAQADGRRRRETPLQYFYRRVATVGAGLLKTTVPPLINSRELAGAQF
jgi:hypothetical protein